MVEYADSQKRDEYIEAKPKSENIKNYVIVGLGLVAAVLAYVLYNRSDLTFEITGQQFIFGSIILAAAIWWVFRERKIPELPEAHEIKRSVADWWYQSGNGFLDFSNCEVTQLSDQRAAVYFRNNEKTFIYQAGKGVIEERHRDLDSELKYREEAKILDSLDNMRIRDESISKFLKDRGYESE